jgi:formylglycine-generating enzyme required for sulfatase activity
MPLPLPEKRPRPGLMAGGAVVVVVAVFAVVSGLQIEWHPGGVAGASVAEGGAGDHPKGAAASRVERDSRNREVPPSVPPTMVFVAAGDFVIGRNDGDGPSRSVHLAGFAIDQYEVSIADVREFIAGKSAAAAEIKAPPKLRPELEDRPMVRIEQRAAVAFCLSRGARLPTEDEWEAAARGAAPGRLYPWGDAWRPECAQVGLGEDGVLAGKNVMTCGQTPGGTAHLAGNAAEWTSTPAVALHGDSPSPDGSFVVRGGSYVSAPADATTSRRRFAKDAASDIGFRCVLPYPAP